MAEHICDGDDGDTKFIGVQASRDPQSLEGLTFSEIMKMTHAEYEDKIDALVKALQDIQKHARRMRKSSDLMGPAEYANRPDAMRVWQKALYSEGKALDEMCRAALTAYAVSSNERQSEV